MGRGIWGMPRNAEAPALPFPGSVGIYEATRHGARQTDSGPTDGRTEGAKGRSRMDGWMASQSDRRTGEGGLRWMDGRTDRGTGKPRQEEEKKMNSWNERMEWTGRRTNMQKLEKRRAGEDENKDRRGERTRRVRRQEKEYRPEE